MQYIEAQIKEWIQRKLGACVINVEATDEQLDDAIEEAKEWWQMWVGERRVVLVPIVSGKVEYPVTDFASDVDTVTDVTFESNGRSFNDLFAWADVEINPYTVVYGGQGGYSDLVQYMQYREMSKEIVSADRDWDYERATRTVTISPKSNIGSRMLVEYISKQMDLSYLTNYEMRVFRDYACGTAMKAVGNIRTKFQGKPSAAGEFSMDGDIMWANGDQLIEKAEEKMGLLQEPVGFFAG